MEGKRVRRAFGVGDHESPIAAFRTRVRSPILLPLLTGVGGLVLLHSIERVVVGHAAPHFSLETDRSFGEVYGYVLAAMIVAGLAILARRSPGMRSLWAVAGFFAFVLADDLLRIHERAGESIGERTGGWWRLPAAEVGQLLYFVVVGAVVAFGGGLVWRAANRPSRVVLAWLGLGVAALGAVAAGLDIVHEMVSDRDGNEIVWVALEDGGEMAVLAGLASYLFARVHEPELDLRIPAIRESVEEVPVQR